MSKGIFGSQPTSRLKVAEVRERRSRKTPCQESPREPQERLMRALQEAGEPLTSADLGKKLGLSPNAVRGHCEWLLENHYIDRKMRKLSRSVAGAMASKAVAFWSLRSKGAEYVATKEATPAEAPKVTVPENL
jgi:predicted ArsR family transcriptional regulator